MKRTTLKAMKKIKDRWLPIGMFMVIFSLLPIGLEYYFIKFTSAEHWFEYQELFVDDLGVTAGDQVILVLSYAVVKRPVELQWNDVLYCKGSNGWEFAGSNQTSNYYAAPAILPRVYVNPTTGVESEVPWRFILPGSLETGQKCYLESTITANLPYGFERTAQIRSNEFVVQ